MSTRLILHIGRHKTGTSAVQNYCRRAQDQFAKYGVIYPDAGRSRDRKGMFPAHHQLAVQCNPQTHRRETFEEIRAAFRDEIVGFETVVLSSEAFQNIRDFTLLRQFFDDIADFDVTVVCYLREYLSYLVSSYRQMVQNQPRFLIFAQYCRRDFRIGEFLDDWSKIGGLVTRPFERSRLKDGDVVADFLSLLGMERESEATKIVNHSIGGNLLFFRLVENHYGLEQTPYLKAEKLALEHPPFRSAFHISDNAAAQIRASAPYNDIVAERIGALSLPSYASEPRVPIVETIDSDVARVYSGARLDTMRSRLAQALDEGADWLEYRPHAKLKNRQKARQTL